MRISTLLAALLCLPACNSMLGVSDVELATDASGSRTPTPDAASTIPDAGPDRSACKVAARYPLITLDSTSASLSRNKDGSPSMFVTPSAGDGLLITLRDNRGGHGPLETFGSFQLTASDTDISICGVCALLGAGFDQNTQSVSQYYMPRMKGQLQISTATATQLIGSMQDLELRHVNIDTDANTTTDNSDHCTVNIDRIDFNLTYSAAALAPSALRAQLVR